MSNSIEPSEPSSSTPTLENIAGVISEIRSQLAIPQSERPEDWQGKVKNLIEIICSDFKSQSDSSIALTEITLVSLAATKGSKEAKTRALKYDRWITGIPPKISEVFEELEEAKIAIRILQNLRTDWIESYVCAELNANKWPNLSTLYVDWLLKSTPTIDSFLEALKKYCATTEKNSYGILATSLDNASKFLMKSYVPPGNEIMVKVCDLVALTVAHKLSGSEPNGEKDEENFRLSLLSFISLISSQNPAILIQGSVIAAIDSLWPNLGKKYNFLQNELEVMCRRTLSLVSVLIASSGKSQIAHFKKIWGAYKIRINASDLLIKNSISEAPDLKVLLSNLEIEETDNFLGNTAAIENIICSLVVNWDDYFPQNSENSAVQQLDGRIADLIQQLGISRFGEVNEILPFDPIRHYLPQTSAEAPSKVSILKPGILIERSDGTQRILLAAAVSPYLKK